MNNSDFLNELSKIEDEIWGNLDLIISTYYPKTTIYDFTNISLSSESVHWVFVTECGQHVSDSKPIKEVFDLLRIKL